MFLVWLDLNDPNTLRKTIFEIFTYFLRKIEYFTTVVVFVKIF